MNKSFLYKTICIAGGLLYFLSNTAQVQPPAYTNTNVNFVRSWNTQRPLTDDNLVSGSVSLQEVTQTTQYLDGLGRPLQTVTRGVTPLGADIVSPVVYDAYGREQYKFLPYASPGTNGNFRTDPFTEQKNFYSDGNTNSPVKGQGQTYYYGQTVFEASPLNRVKEIQAPGNSWVGSQRGVEMQFYTNTDADGVRVWTVTNNSTAGTFDSYSLSSTNPVYDAGELYKTITIDEDGKQVIEFKDKEGNLILKKVQITSSVVDNGTGSLHAGWLCTYYIYDDLKNLRCVVQPAGVEVVKGTWTLTDATILAEQCFRYEYDGRNRMTMKQVPGSATINMVYDNRDRLIMSQDGNLKTQGKWMITDYDALNRPVETGLLTDANTAATHQANANNTDPATTSYPNTSGSNYELLTQVFYDDYAWFSSSGSSFTTSSTSGGFDWSQASSGFQTATNTVFPYPQAKPLAQQKTNTGLVTGTRTKVLGSSQYLYTVIYYDDKERIIQTKSTNITGGMEVSTSQYSFDGKLLVNKIDHNILGTKAQTHTLVTTNSYDAAGRLLTIKKKIDNQGTQSIVDNSYDELGQLKTKKLAPAYNNSNGLSSLTYDYNIRGWLLGLNRSYVLTTNTPTGRKFGYELAYDKTSSTSGQFFDAAQFNGNINGVMWKSSGDGIRRKYDFTYDKANRLLKADFKQNNDGTSVWDNSQVNYNVKIGDGSNASSAYDNNGNIKRMQQWGLEIGGSNQIDDLTYNYISKSNKLLNVSDAFNDNQTVLGDFRISSRNPVQIKTTTTADYTYDLNGNLLKDLNKDLGTSNVNGISYNHLNLPKQILAYAYPELVHGAAKGSINYTYDALGNKLNKVTWEYQVSVSYNGSTYWGTVKTTTSYINGFVYESKDYSNASLTSLNYTDVLQFVGHEEGRIRYKPADNTVSPVVSESFVYDYFIKDHLGNVRMMLTEEAQTDTYPVASMETGNAATEKLYYSKIDETRATKPSGYPADTYTNPNTYAAKVNGNGNKIGPGIVLKVMAGDQFNIRVNSWYRLNGATPGTPVSPLTDLLSVLTSGVATASSGKASQTQLASSGVLSPEITDFLSGQTITTGRPKAYINWVFFDDQFKYVSTGSGFEQVGADQVFTTHTRNNLPANKNGYLYIYISNETPNIDVYFDNLQVTHIRGPMLEETHYYPFGLTMAGISSKAAGGIENKKKFVGQTFDDDLGWDTYQFKFRTHDPQLGRFLQIDPLAAQYAHNSTYAYAENKPINGIDLEGLEWLPINKDGQGVKLEDKENINGYKWAGYDVDAKTGEKTAKAGTVATAYTFGEEGRTTLGVDKNGDASKRWESYSSLSTGDAATDRKTSTLHSSVQNEVKEFILKADNRFGLKLRVTDGFRSIEQQDKLYAQGRTEPGNRVTNARGGYSNHNFGLAVDVVPMQNGQPNFNSNQYPLIGRIGQSVGLEWGGNWKSITDMPHFQNLQGLSLSQLRALPKDEKGLPVLPQ